MNLRAFVTWVAVATSLVSCRLSSIGKSSCVTSADCLSGRQCVSGNCAAVSGEVVPRDTGPSVERSPSADAGAQEPETSVEGPPSAEAGAQEAETSVQGPSPCTGGLCAASTAGKQMTCFQATSLAGSDFCTEACDLRQPPADRIQYECVPSGASGALLRRCHPSSSSTPQADCPPGLDCYRTSLLDDTGLCIQMPVCATDTDCPRPPHNVCAATIVKSLSSAASLLRLDHLNCVQTGCSALQSMCASAEGCLGTQYSSPVDMCAPVCDSKKQCPPNFSCVGATSGAGSPDLCVPGLPGERCNGDRCVLGSCEDTGAGFSVCTLQCASDNQCQALSKVDFFACVDAPMSNVSLPQDGGHRHCVDTTVFDGANCATTDQCNTARNEFCAHVDVYAMDSMRGECRVPCNRDGTCDPQGGLPHGCLVSVSGKEGGCYPGVLGIPCTRDAECVKPLTCNDVSPEDNPDASGSRICTMPCPPQSAAHWDLDAEASDAPEASTLEAGGDADVDSACAVLPTKAYCGGGFCRVGRLPGKPCGRPAQCSSRLCGGATNVCLPPQNKTGGP